MEIEDTFSISIPDETAARLLYVHELIDFVVEQKPVRRGSSGGAFASQLPWTHEEIEREVCRCIERVLGLPAGDVRPAHHIIDDLPTT